MHAFLAKPRERVEVGQLAVDRRVVELEVAGMHDDPDRCPQGDAHRVRDRVPDAERHDGERADRHLVAGLQGVERIVVELVLLDLVAQQAAGQRGRVDGHARELGEDVRQPSDMVLVRVRDEERPDVLAALLEIGHVGHDEVDAEHLLVGEHQAAVDDHDVVAVLEHVHVLADLADAAERQDAERGATVGRLLGHRQNSVSWSASGWARSTMAPGSSGSEAVVTAAGSGFDAGSAVRCGGAGTRARWPGGRRRVTRRSLRPRLERRRVGQPVGLGRDLVDGQLGRRRHTRCGRDDGERGRVGRG